MNLQVFWSPGMTLEGLSDQVIEKAFQFYNQNKTVTAQSLGITVRTLENRMEKYAAKKQAFADAAAKEKITMEEFSRRQRAFGGAKV